MERKLYSLEAINSRKPENRHVIQIKNEKGEYETKTYLANIYQHITTYFKNLKQLLFYLKQKNIISDFYDDVKITYRHNGIQAIDPVYMDQNIIAKVSKNSKTSVNLETNSSEFIYSYHQFLKLCEENEFLEFINKSNQIPERLKLLANKINKRICTSDHYQEKQEVENEIWNCLIHYKNFRTIVLYMTSYCERKSITNKITLPENNQKEIIAQTFLKEKSEETIEYDRYEQEEFLTEEELEQGYGSDQTYYRDAKK